MGPNDVVVVWAPGNFSFMLLLFYFQLIVFFITHRFCPGHDNGCHSYHTNEKAQETSFDVSWAAGKFILIFSFDFLIN